MNETAAAANDVLQDIATSDVIMTEVVIYALASLVILLLMDFYAAKRIGNKRPRLLWLKASALNREEGNENE